MSSYCLYVGNYPSDFTKEDLKNLFCEFGDIIVEKFVKSNVKCYSFVRCKDIDQLVSIIQNMNNAVVSGRKLKVRARDNSLQEYVKLLFQEINDDKNSDVTPPSLAPLQMMKNKYRSLQSSEEDGDVKFEEIPSGALLNRYQTKHEMNNSELVENTSCHSPEVLQDNFEKIYEKKTGESSNSGPFSLSKSQNSYENTNRKSFEDSNLKTVPFQKKSNYEKDTNVHFRKSACYSPRPPQNNYHKPRESFKTDPMLSPNSSNHEMDTNKQFENSACYPPRNNYKKYDGEQFKNSSLLSPQNSSHEKDTDKQFENITCYPTRNNPQTRCDNEHFKNNSLLSPKSSSHEKDTDREFENSTCYPPRNNHKTRFESGQFKNNPLLSLKSSSYEKDTDRQFENSAYYTPKNNYKTRCESGQIKKNPLLMSPKSSTCERNSDKQFENSACYPPKQNYKKKYKNNEHFKKQTGYSPNPSEYSCQQRSEKFKKWTDKQYQEKPFNSSQYNYDHEHNFYSDSVDVMSAGNRYSEDLYEEFDEFTWLSVTNFPIGTSIRCMYELFSDYDPIEIKMICNSPRRDRTLTEALVCFWNRDIANDVILNFDNTIFDGRLILVNDIEDLTIINELLDVAHHK